MGLSGESTDAPDITALLKEAGPRVLRMVYRRSRDFAASEDAVQDALLAAATQWPRDGFPANPVGWLARVAFRRSIDAIRSQTAARRRERDTFVAERPDRPEDEEDETLTFLFLCCHPSLSTASSIALTLRAVAGLTTAEIARAYFVSETTMAQRISRAKDTIRASGKRLERPKPQNRARRLGSVLRVLYVMFSEGYLATVGPGLTRDDRSGEALRLVRLLADELPQEPEVKGLLSLMLLTQARRPARTGPDGELIPLDRQNRTLWNRVQIEEGIRLVTEALGRRAPGPYQLEAAIAAVHDEAERFEDTDWPQILSLYEFLWEKTANPMIKLSQAVALAMVRGPREGLRVVEAVAGDARLSGGYRLDAVRAHLLRMAGDVTGAANGYRAAARKTLSLAERDFLLIEAAELSRP